MHEKRVEIRWRDVDQYGHVNNAVYLTYLEEARDEWLELALGDVGDSWDFVLAHVSIDYRRELRLEDDWVIVRCGLERLGNSSVRTREMLVLSDGTVSAEAQAVMVARDRAAGKSRSLSELERKKLNSAPKAAQ